MSIVRVAESPIFKALHEVRMALMSPFVSGPLLAALVATPDDTRQALLRRLSLSPNLDIGIVKTALQVLLGIGVVRYVNSLLSTMASNHGRLSAAKSWDWPKEIVVITGGSSGIGHAIVQRLVRNKIKVAVLDVQDLPKTLSNQPLVHFYKCDITSPEAVAEAGAAIRRDIGQPTILINNAGIVKPLPILDIPTDLLNKAFQVNTISHWTMVKEFLPDMIKRNHGHVITLASIASFVALAKGAEYSATKASALSFHESLTCELKHFYKADGVLTSVIHPNFVRTPLVADFGSALEESGVKLLTTDVVADQIIKHVLSKRGGQVIIPGRQDIIAGIRGWPTWMQEVVRGEIGRAALKV